MYQNDDDKKMTIHDVAKNLGVSASTVSRAISGKGRIGKETKEKILRYIADNNYYPNAVAQSLAQARTYNLAIVLPENDNIMDMPFFHTCVYSIQDYAQANGYDVIVIIASNGDVRSIERLLTNHKVDGLILTRTMEDDPAISLLKDYGVPFVVIGVAQDGIVQVDNDNVGACKELATVLLNKGIRRIGYLGGEMSQTVNRCRLDGVRMAYADADIKMDEDLIYTELENKNMIDRAITELLDKKVDCILCQDDTYCADALSVLTSKNIKIPEQMKIASCHHSRMLENNPITITSIKFDVEELARSACKFLLYMLDNRSVPERTVLDYEIRLKESTK